MPERTHAGSRRHPHPLHAHDRRPAPPRAPGAPCSASRRARETTQSALTRLDLARQFLEKATAPAEHQGATVLVAKIDTALSPSCTRSCESFLSPPESVLFGHKCLLRVQARRFRDFRVISGSRQHQSLFDSSVRCDGPGTTLRLARRRESNVCDSSHGQVTSDVGGRHFPFGI